jgi:hypothetical protein
VRMSCICMGGIMRRRPTSGLGLGALLLLLATLPAAAQDREASLTFRNHAFDPPELSLPAGARIKLTVKNADATPAEFECTELRREKVVPAKGQGIVYLGPLKAGSYECFDDFHPETRGKIIVK